MKVIYTLTKEEVWNTYKYIYFKTKRYKVELVPFVPAVTLMIGMLFYSVIHSIIISVALSIVTTLLGLYLRYFRVKRKVYKSTEEQYGILDEKTIEIKDDGISVVTKHDESFFEWIVINSIEITDEYIYIKFDSLTTIIFPKRIFHSKDEAVRFYNIANMFMEKAKQK